MDFLLDPNLWVSLLALKERLEANDYVLRLPMIRNAKTVDPRDPSRREVMPHEETEARRFAAHHVPHAA